MKAVKRFFKRNKRQHEGRTLAERPPAAPGRPIRKSTPPGLPERLQPSQSSGPSKARASSGSSPSPAVQQPKLSLQTVATPTSVNPPRRLASDDTEKRSSGKSTTPNSSQAQQPAKTTTGTTSVSAKEEDEKGTYKGVSELFKKGLSVTQRYGVGESNEDQPSTDPNQLGKIGDAYDSIPVLEQTKLPRGGISMETKAVGRVQVSHCCGRSREGISFILHFCAHLVAPTTFPHLDFIVRYPPGDHQR